MAHEGDIALSVREGGRKAKWIWEIIAHNWRPATILAACVGLWWLVTAFGLVKPYLIPPPPAVWQALQTEWALIARHTAITLWETLAGFTIALVLGEVVAVLVVMSPSLERSVYPIILFLQIIPKIALAPLFVVWLGFGLAPKIVVAVLMAFFPVTISGVAGLRSVEPELLDLAATMGAGRWKTFYKIQFPASLPHLFAGIKVAATMAVAGAVVGEFVGANQGLGYLLLIANGNLNAPLLFAGLLVMSVIGIGLFLAIEVTERLLLPWHASYRQQFTSTSLG